MIEDVERIMRLFIDEGQRGMAPFMGRQRDFWSIEGLPFTLYNCTNPNRRGSSPFAAYQPGERHFRRYAFRRHMNLKRAWTLTVVDATATLPVRGVHPRYETLEAPIGDHEQADEDLMLAFLRA